MALSLYKTLKSRGLVIFLPLLNMGLQKIYISSRRLMLVHVVFMIYTTILPTEGQLMGPNYFNVHYPLEDALRRKISQSTQGCHNMAICPLVVHPQVYLPCELEEIDPERLCKFEQSNRNRWKIVKIRKIPNKPFVVRLKPVQMVRSGYTDIENGKWTEDEGCETLVADVDNQLTNVNTATNSDKTPHNALVDSPSTNVQANRQAVRIPAAINLSSINVGSGYTMGDTHVHTIPDETEKGSMRPKDLYENKSNNKASPIDEVKMWNSPGLVTLNYLAYFRNNSINDTILMEKTGNRPDPSVTVTGGQSNKNSNISQTYKKEMHEEKTSVLGETLSDSPTFEYPVNVLPLNVKLQKSTSTEKLLDTRPWTDEQTNYASSFDQPVTENNLGSYSTQPRWISGLEDMLMSTERSMKEGEVKETKVVRESSINEKFTTPCYQDCGCFDCNIPDDHEFESYNYQYLRGQNPQCECYPCNITSSQVYFDELPTPSCLSSRTYYRYVPR